MCTRSASPGDVERLSRPGDICRELIIELLEKRFFRENSLAIVEGVFQTVEVRGGGLVQELVECILTLRVGCAVALKRDEKVHLIPGHKLVRRVVPVDPVDEDLHVVRVDLPDDASDDGGSVFVHTEGIERMPVEHKERFARLCLFFAEEALSFQGFDGRLNDLRIRAVVIPVEGEMLSVRVVLREGCPHHEEDLMDGCFR